MKPSISILIPAWNEEKIIPKTCQYLKKLVLPFDYSELIFIAGGSDATFKTCQNQELDNFTNVITIEQKPGDFKSGALIKGMWQSKGDIITIMDADLFLAPKMLVNISKTINNFDVVCCNYIPMMVKNFWYRYQILFKEIWGSNPMNLGSLIGGATISFKKELLKKISPEEMFSDRSTAGVDYYMGRVFKMHHLKIGLVKTPQLLVPRPNYLKDFIRDQKRWLTAYFSIHQGDMKLLLVNFFFNFLHCFGIPLLFVSSIKKLRKVSKNSFSFIKSLYTLFFSDYLINFMGLIYFIKLLLGKLKSIGHFKGQDRYLT